MQLNCIAEALVYDVAVSWCASVAQTMLQGVLVPQAPALLQQYRITLHPKQSNSSI
jgi:hypothetical protein